jgi:hypothetical protein
MKIKGMLNLVGGSGRIVVVKPRAGQDKRPWGR